MKESTMNNFPQYVYHYTTLKGLTGIISSSSILFSSFAKSDDLRERVLNSDGYNYICFCYGEDAENKPAMWSKYADNSNGVCIKLNFTKLLELNKEVADQIEHSPIKYENTKFLSTGQDYGHEMEYKNDNWSYQSEYRIISKTVRSLVIDKDVIEHVVFVETWENGIYKEIKDLTLLAGKCCFTILCRGEVKPLFPTVGPSIEWSEYVTKCGNIFERLKNNKTSQI